MGGKVIRIRSAGQLFKWKTNGFGSNISYCSLFDESIWGV